MKSSPHCDELTVQRKLRTLIKRALAVLAYYSGISLLYCAVALRRRAVVLMYHRVLPSEMAAASFSTGAIVVTPATFEMQMRFLRRHFNPVTAEELSAMLRGTAPWRPRACLVTFDDGWWDNAEHALPILQRNQVPAIVFLATAYVGTERCFWQENLTFLLLKLSSKGAMARALFEELGVPGILTMPPEQARKVAREIVSDLKRSTPQEQDALIERARALLGNIEAAHFRDSPDRFMSWQQVCELQRSEIVELGSHAHSHTPLPKLTDTQVREELQHAHREMTRHLNISPSVFAYPNGDYQDGVVREVSAMGYQLAFTTDPGWVQRGDPPLRLRRVNIAESGTASAPEFLCRLLTWF